MPVGILPGEGHAHARQVTVPPRLEHAEHGGLDLRQLVDPAHLFQGLGRGRVEAEHHRVHLDLAEELGVVWGQGKAVGVHGDGDAAPLHVGQHLAQVGNEQRLAVDGGRHHRLHLAELIEHLACGVEVHDALDVVDLLFVLQAPYRAHMAAQIAARGKVDEQPLRHVRDRQRLPIV